jgi:hypothetical protein
MMSNDTREKVYGLILTAIICFTVVKVVSIMSSSMSIVH